MKILITEQLSPHRFKTPEGYLICTDAILARTGKQTYKRGEVFGADCDDAASEIEVDRPKKEVFSEKTLASFENKPITVEHPDENVNSSNWKEYQVGFVRDVKRGKTKDGEDVILGTLVIQDQQTIEEIENGEHTDLSCGYDCDIEDSANPYQKNIRGNHVALCQQGRAGIARIVDSTKRSKSDSINDDNELDTIRGILTDLIVNKNYEIDEALQRLYKFRPNSKANVIWEALAQIKMPKRLELIKSFGFKDSTKDTYIAETTVQCYIFDGNKILIQDRVGPVWKGLAVPGGHVESGENFEEACIREVKEETGLNVYNLKRFEVESYECNGGIGVAILYKTTSFDGNLRSSNEGRMSWMEIEDVFNSNETAEGFKDLLKRCCREVRLGDVNPRRGESKEDFISRFMEETKNEYPDRQQRLAIAYSYWRKSKDSVKEIFDEMEEKLNKMKDYEPPYAVWVKTEENGKWKIYGGSNSMNVDRDAYLKLGYVDVTVVKNGSKPRDSVKDSTLTLYEKSLCNYMLENVYDKGMKADDLLRKMKLYYSEYSRLAREKESEVLEYFEDQLDEGIYDSVKDSTLTRKEAIDMIKRTSVPHESRVEFGTFGNGWCVQFQNVGMASYPDVTKYKHVSPTESSYCWLRIWKDKDLVFVAKDKINVAKQQAIRFLEQRTDDSIKDAYSGIDEKTGFIFNYHNKVWTITNPKNDKAVKVKDSKDKLDKDKAIKIALSSKALDSIKRR